MMFSNVFNNSLQYHILQGAYQSGSIPDDLAFVPTILNNTQYANVTGGQVVGVERDDDNVTIFSGLLQNSSVSSAVCAILHVQYTFRHDG
jgi:hypothetical protein